MVAASMFITYETATRIPRLHYRDVEPRLPDCDRPDGSEKLV